LIHDSNGYRTAMIWAAYRVSHGMDPRKALAEVQALRDYPALQERIERYALSISTSP
jgi:IMP cyclohydrolase